MGQPKCQKFEEIRVGRDEFDPRQFWIDQVFVERCDRLVAILPEPFLDLSLRLKGRISLTSEYVA